MIKHGPCLPMLIGRFLKTKPNIDQLASEGLRFDQFLVEHTCSATRAATMTGRYSIRTTAGGSAMQGSERTLAEILKDVGYTTAAYGKWHMGWGDGCYLDE